jgi:hypothetical protein
MHISKTMLVAAAVALAPSAALASTVYNSAPADGWFYGNGNNYSPANTTVLTTDAGDQLYLRWHQTGKVAPASASGVYSFALGTAPLSFDWGIGGAFTGASITVLNVGSNATKTFNVFDPYGIGAPIFNDNSVKFGDTQNSARLSFSFADVGYNAALNDTYRVTLNVFGLAGGTQSLSVDAKLGTGAAPEPATWAMMVGGFGLIGGALRRRQRTSVRFA